MNIANFLCEKENGKEYDEKRAAIYNQNLTWKCIIGHVPLMFSEAFKKFL